MCYVWLRLCQDFTSQWFKPMIELNWTKYIAPHNNNNTSLPPRRPLDLVPKNKTLNFDVFLASIICDTSLLG